MMFSSAAWFTKSGLNYWNVHPFKRRTRREKTKLEGIIIMLTHIIDDNIKST